MWDLMHQIQCLLIFCTSQRLVPALDYLGSLVYADNALSGIKISLSDSIYEDRLCIALQYTFAWIFMQKYKTVTLLHAKECDSLIVSFLLGLKTF